MYLVHPRTGRAVRPGFGDCLGAFFLGPLWLILRGAGWSGLFWLLVIVATAVFVWPPFVVWAWLWFHAPGAIRTGYRRRGWRASAVPYLDDAAG